MKLIFIHGIFQSRFEEDVLFKKWVDNFKIGISKNKELDPKKLEKIDIDFMYYGKLYEKYESKIPFTILFSEMIEFVKDLVKKIDPLLVQSIQDDYSISKSKNIDPDLILKKFIKIIQGKFPFVDSVLISSIAKETYLYFNCDEYRLKLKDQLLSLLDSESVIVGHSLGSVIAYDNLVRIAHNNSNVNKLITLGSPLGTDYMKRRLVKSHPIEMPKSIKNNAWKNLYGKEDFVSLYPLDAKHFKTDPEIKNQEVETDEKKPHNITGYLSNKDVATEIYKSLGL